MSHEKNPGCLGYIGDYTTRLYRFNGDESHGRMNKSPEKNAKCCSSTAEMLLHLASQKKRGQAR